MTRDSVRRRRFLGVTAATMAVGLAGCSGGAADTGGSAEGSDVDSDGGAESAGTDFDGWFDGVSNYDGVVDSTGQSTVTLAVGAQGNGGGYAFAPAAVKVEAGTTVVWEWTGDGGSHNVVHEDGVFESELVAGEGETFSHTFDSVGTYLYVCVPHEAMGMKGAVVVE